VKNISFVVRIECRMCGAIGLFTPTNYYVSRPDEESARKAVFDEAQAAGYETRFILSTKIV